MIHSKAKLAKELQARREKLEVQAELHREAYISAKQAYKLTERRIEDLSIDIFNLTRNEPTITEHALVRYFEKIEGYDIDDIKRQILSDEMRELIDKLGSGKYPLPCGGTAVVKDKAIISIQNNNNKGK